MRNVSDALLAPFPYFGGKRRIARDVWDRFGDVRNYVEPFFGSGAVLLQRPLPFDGSETVNDVDGLLCNFWRAVATEPDTVATFADWPVSECDLSARHLKLVEVRADLTAWLEADPGAYDAQLAGWWVWGACSWIGSGWCSGEGPWVRDGDRLTSATRAAGINKQLPHLGDAGRGIASWLRDLAERLRRVRIACGSWERVLGPSVTWRHGLTGVFLDPPYLTGEMEYSAARDIGPLATSVAEWAAENGARKDMRIALCGHAGDYDDVLKGWECMPWKARGGYGNQDDDDANDNRHREVIWFSPACKRVGQGSLFDMTRTA